jgi:hypothetical protein
MFNSTIVPFSVMFTSSLIIIFNLYKSRKKIHRKSTIFNIPITDSSTLIQASNAITNQNSSSSNLIPTSRIKREKRVYDNLLARNQDYQMLLQGIIYFLFFSDYSIKFFLYLAINKRFLSEFKQLVIRK